jgi:hypothetical protein
MLIILLFIQKNPPMSKEDAISNLVNEWILDRASFKAKGSNSNELLSMCYQMEGRLVVILAQEICRYAKHVTLS